MAGRNYKKYIISHYDQNHFCFAPPATDDTATQRGCSKMTHILGLLMNFHHIFITHMKVRFTMTFDPFARFKHVICQSYAVKFKCHIGVSPSGQKMGNCGLSQSHVQDVSGIDTIMKKRFLN